MIYDILVEIFIDVMKTISSIINNIEVISFIFYYYFLKYYVIVFQNENIIRNNTFLFKYLKNPSLEIAILACYSLPSNVKYINRYNLDEFDKHLIYKYAINKSCNSLKFIKNQPLDIILYAIINYPYDIVFEGIENKTYDIYKISVECGISLKHVPTEFITKEICYLNDYRDLKFILPEYYDLNIIKKHFKKNVYIYNDLININFIDLFDIIIENKFEECVICNSDKKYFLKYNCNHPICVDCLINQIKFKYKTCYYRCYESLIDNDKLYFNINY